MARPVAAAADRRRLLLRLAVSLRLGWQPGGGERAGAVGVVLHPHDPALADGEDHAGSAVRESPLGEPRAGDLDEDTLVDRDDGVEGGNDTLALALEERGEDLTAGVAIPVARLLPQPPPPPG